VLTDEALRQSVWNHKTTAWFVVLAASPNKLKKSQKWKKERNSSLYFMSIWGWCELFAAYWYDTNVSKVYI